MHSWIQFTKGADKNWVLIRYSSYSTTNVTALVPAACWSCYRALSARRRVESLTYTSNPVGLLPSPSPNPWILYTEQGYGYVFVRVVAVVVYRGFSTVASVCVNWNANAEERACYLALMWVLASLYLQPHFAKTLCKWSCFCWTLIGNSLARE